MINTPPFRLGGELDPNAWHFARLGEEGPLPNPVGHTFPLLTHDESGIWRLVGTGFYVSDAGFFITARHVIEEVMQNGRQTSPLLILHLHSSSGLFGPSECSLRPIARCWISQFADIAFGMAAAARHNVTGEFLKHWSWTVSFGSPPIGSSVGTYAFPNHIVSDDGIKFSPHLYSGRVLGIGEYRDKVMLPFPYIQADFRIHGAASGGPIVAGSHVVGVNCTEWPENLDHPPGPSFGTQIRCLTGAFLDNVVLPTEANARSVTFDELVRANCLNVVNYEQPSAAPREGLLVDVTMPPSARLPKIEVEQYM